MDHDQPGARALQALKTLQELDLKFISQHPQAAVKVRNKLKLISRRKKGLQPRKDNESTDLLRVTQPDPTNANKAYRALRSKESLSSNSIALAPEPCSPQPYSIVLELMEGLDDSQETIKADLMNRKVEEDVTARPDYLEQDARYLDLKPPERTPVAKAKRLLARRWAATEYELWKKTKHNRSRVSELLESPTGKPKTGTIVEFLNSPGCHLHNTPVSREGIWEGLKLLILEKLCGCNEVSAIVNYQSTCLKGINMSELRYLSVAIQRSTWIMAFMKTFVEGRPNWLNGCQARYNAWYGSSSRLVIQRPPSSSPNARSQSLGNSFEPPKEAQEVEGVEGGSHVSDPAERDNGSFHHSQDVTIGYDGHEVPSSAYDQMSCPPTLFYNKPQTDRIPEILYTPDTTTPDLQAASQVFHDETSSQRTPFIQLSTYLTRDWATINPNLDFGVSHVDMAMMSDVQYPRQDINDSIQYEHQLQHVPLAQPMFHQ